MKQKLLLLSALATLAGFTSCSSTDDDVDGGSATTTPSNLSLDPSTQSTVDFYSNGVKLTTANAAGETTETAPVSYETITTTDIDAEEEKDVIQSILPEKNGNTDNINTDFLYYAKDGDVTFDFYFVYGMSTTYHNIGIYYYDEDNNMVQVPITQWQGIYTYYPNNGTVSTTWAWSDEAGSYAVNTYTGVRITVKQGYKFGFYWNGHLKNGDSYEETTYYTTPSLNAESQRTDGDGTDVEGTSTVHAGTFYYNGKTYLGLEDWTDFDYQDIVFTCVGEVATTTSDDTTPDVVEETETPSDPDEDTTETLEDPAAPEVQQYDGSVEVNLALNAERETDDYIYSHLSIHVRDTTDVTITLPIPAAYTVASDDMMIVMNHAEENYVLNDAQESFSMVIAGQTVTLTINHTETAIYITTSGINSTVLKYLRENFNDGITFEVRTYFNVETAPSRTELQELLNQSTIEFENATAVYVAAYGYTTEDVAITEDSIEHRVTTTIDPWACTVLPTDIDDRVTPTTYVDYSGSQLWLYPLTTAVATEQE